MCIRDSCSLIGGLSVVCTQGLGSAILAQINGEAQFNKWFTYVLIVFVIATLLTEIIYLNVSGFGNLVMREAPHRFALRARKTAMLTDLRIESSEYF